MNNSSVGMIMEKAQDCHKPSLFHQTRLKCVTDLSQGEVTLLTRRVGSNIELSHESTVCLYQLKLHLDLILYI
jgi:hypothetical protein